MDRKESLLSSDSLPRISSISTHKFHAAQSSPRSLTNTRGIYGSVEVLINLGNTEMAEVHADV